MTPVANFKANKRVSRHISSYLKGYKPLTEEERKELLKRMRVFLWSVKRQAESYYGLKSEDVQGVIAVNDPEIRHPCFYFSKTKERVFIHPTEQKYFVEEKCSETSLLFVLKDMVKNGCGADLTLDNDPDLRKKTLTLIAQHRLDIDVKELTQKEQQFFEEEKKKARGAPHLVALKALEDVLDIGDNPALKEVRGLLMQSPVFREILQGLKGQKIKITREDTGTSHGLADLKNSHIKLNSQTKDIETLAATLIHEISHFKQPRAGALDVLSTHWHMHISEAACEYDVMNVSYDLGELYPGILERSVNLYHQAAFISTVKANGGVVDDKVKSEVVRAHFQSPWARAYDDQLVDNYRIMRSEPGRKLMSFSPEEVLKLHGLTRTFGNPDDLYQAAFSGVHPKTLKKLKEINPGDTSLKRMFQIEQKKDRPIEVIAPPESMVPFPHSTPYPMPKTKSA